MPRSKNPFPEDLNQLATAVGLFVVVVGILIVLSEFAIFFHG